MTSTSINVGISDERKSSRVLKPPGGGHSDIFGVKEEIPLPKKAQPPKSEISQCFAAPPFDKSAAQSENQNEGNKTVSQNSNGTATDENTKPAGEEEKTVKPPQRVRVPPGGFSSGLW